MVFLYFCRIPYFSVVDNNNIHADFMDSNFYFPTGNFNILIGIYNIKIGYVWDKEDMYWMFWILIHVPSISNYIILSDMSGMTIII